MFVTRLGVRTANHKTCLNSLTTMTYNALYSHNQQNLLMNRFYVSHNNVIEHQSGGIQQKEKSFSNQFFRTNSITCTVNTKQSLVSNSSLLLKCYFATEKNNEEKKTEKIQQEKQQKKEEQQVNVPSRWDKIKAQLKIFKKQFIEGCQELSDDIKKSLQIREKMKLKGTDSLTRADLRHLQKTYNDVKSFIPFSILLLILPEIIPFIILVKPNFLPSTFSHMFSQEKRLIKQRQHQLIVTERLRKAFVATFANENNNIFTAIGTNAETKWRSQLNVESGMPRKMVFAMYDLMTNKRSIIRPEWYVRYSLDKLLQSIAKDDILINKEGGIENLSMNEIKEACEERKIELGASQDIASLTPFEANEVRKSLLQDWLDLSLHSKMIPTSYLILYNAGLVKKDESLKENDRKRMIEMNMN